MYDIGGDGVLDLVLSRDDGQVEVHSVDEQDGHVLKFKEVTLTTYTKC